MTRDRHLMQIGISVMLKRDFGWKLYEYIRVCQEYIIHHGPELSTSEEYTVHAQYLRFHFLL